MEFRRVLFRSEGLREHMIGVANTKHLGRPLFGGTTGTDQAFDPNGTYIGDDGAIERTVMDGLTVQVNVTDEQVFGTNGSNVFDVLTDIVDSLRNDPSALNANLEALDERAVAFRSRSEEHTSELQSLMRISYAVFCLKKTTNT